MTRQSVSPIDQLIAALVQFADKRGHWPNCRASIRYGMSTTLTAEGDIIVTPCSKRCRQTREAVEAAGGTVDQPPPRVFGPRDKRTLADMFGHLRGCSLIPGAEYHHDSCKHSREAV